MALSRRNILIGLGALVGGGGALVGTGAFSTVSAQRSVEVTTAGDGSAFLGITEDSPYVNNEGGNTANTVEFILESQAASGSENATGFNENAITTLTDVATIANNAQDGSTVNIGLSTAAPSANPTADSDHVTISLSSADIEFHLGSIDSESDGAVSVEPGSTTNIDVVVDTTVSNDTSSTTGNLTIVADSQ